MPGAGWGALSSHHLCDAKRKMATGPHSCGLHLRGAVLPGITTTVTREKRQARVLVSSGRGRETGQGRHVVVGGGGLWPWPRSLRDTDEGAEAQVQENLFNLGSLQFPDL